MTTIILTTDKQLQVTTKEVIMQYSNLVDHIQFLIPQQIGENNMNNFDAVQLEYLSPISKLYRQEFLVRSEELYKNRLQYLLPVDTKITAEHGNIELQLSFYKTEMTAEGEVQAVVFKTQPCIITVVPTKNWAQFMPSESLMSLDQRILKLLALQEEISSLQEQILSTQGAVIDDENISDKTTYSSKKIEEFIDQKELNEVVDEIENNVISDEDISGLFTNAPSDDINDDANDVEVITNEDIESLF